MSTIRFRLRLAALCAALSPGFPGSIEAQSPPSPRQEYTDQVIVKFRDAKTARAFLKLIVSRSLAPNFTTISSWRWVDALPKN